MTERGVSPGCAGTEVTEMNGQFYNQYDLTGLKYFFIAVIAGEAAGLVLSPLESSRGGMAFIFIFIVALIAAYAYSLQRVKQYSRHFSNAAWLVIAMGATYVVGVVYAYFRITGWSNGTVADLKSGIMIDPDASLNYFLEETEYLGRDLLILESVCAFIGLCFAGGLWREYICGLTAIPARAGDQDLKKSCQRVWKLMCPAIVCGLILIPLVDYLMIRTMDDITNLSFDTAGSWIMIIFVACGVGILGLVAVILLLVQTWNVYSRYHGTPVGLRLEDICPQCGCLLRQGVRFCENCGTKIPWRS